MSSEGPAGSVGRLAATVSAVGSTAVVVSVGSLCALVYPVIKELRAERVVAEDGTEERMLGFWSILVLSVLVGCVCSVFSWTLCYLDSHQPGLVSQSPPTVPNYRDVFGHGSPLGYGVPVLNGVMAALTVVWSLS
ncbi:ADP-ribosylation factor-like protein 6-interacting protein 6 [Menidia menidia]